jgi:hypothetical protein
MLFSRNIFSLLSSTNEITIKYVSHLHIICHFVPLKISLGAIEPTTYAILFRGNNISDIKEVQKLKCLPLLRALVLMGKWISSPSSWFKFQQVL